MIPDIEPVRKYFLSLQDAICAGLEQEDRQARFREDAWTRNEGGGGRTRILADGLVFEKAGVGFSHVSGATLPASATARRPELAGKAWQAIGVSVVVHPHNPYAPTSHLNVRFFAAEDTFWFGGGFDLTPYYGFTEDAVLWHRTARDVLAPFGPEWHPRFKKACDDYFYLKHRGEARGIGGVFFDDFDQLGFARSFALVRSVGDAYLPAYRGIVARRKHMNYAERERDFQLQRRGRYVEFNLLWDRGTLFGLQSGGRTESILMSLPPLARWDYQPEHPPGSPEANLVADFLTPRDWAGASAP